MDGFKKLFLTNLNKFSESDRELFDRIYAIWETKGSLVAPDTMIPTIEKTFGNLESVLHQDFIKIINKITYEGAVFNELRTMRPVIGEENISEIHEIISKASNGAFSRPLEATPADTFGRVQGKYCITASNFAKYDGLHGLIIFDNHNPLLISRKRVRDYFNVARNWYKKAHESNPLAIYPILTWNCLWKASASVVHGHAQMAITEGMAYAKIEEYRHLTLRYQEEYRSNYTDDKYNLHDKLGLAVTKNGVRIISKITPIKEKELEIFAPSFDDNFADVLSDIINTYKETLGVLSFNLIIILPPMTSTYEFWTHMPIMAKLVDRGSLTNKTVDIGSMELYAQSVIGSNPYTVIDKLKTALKI